MNLHRFDNCDFNSEFNTDIQNTVIIFTRIIMSLRSIIQQKRSEDIIDIIGKDLYVEFRKGDNISLPQPIVTSVQQLNKINPILTTAFLKPRICIGL